MLMSWVFLVFGGVVIGMLYMVIWLFLETDDLPVRLGSLNLNIEPLVDSIDICRV